MQLLSHQTHIATKIELFLSKDAALEDAQFQRLGCVHPLPLAPPAALLDPNSIANGLANGFGGR